MLLARELRDVPHGLRRAPEPDAAPPVEPDSGGMPPDLDAGATDPDAGIDDASGTTPDSGPSPTPDAGIDDSATSDADTVSDTGPAPDPDAGSPPPSIDPGGLSPDPCPTLADADYFVSAADGSDADDGQTEATAWRTLTKAASVAASGDCVLVRAGTYAEELAPANAGADGALVTFKAHPSDACQGGLSKIGCRVVLSQAVRLAQPYLRIDGFEIVSATGEDAVSVDGDHAEVVNNFIHGLGGYTDAIGVFVTARADYTLVENNEIREVYRGVKNDNQVQVGAVIRANQIHRTYCDGIRGGGVRMLIDANWIHSAHTEGCHRDALDLSNFVDGVIRNNVISDFTQLIYLSPDDGNPSQSIDNVEVYGNVLYVDEYPGDPGGEAPGVMGGLGPGAAPETRWNNVRIHSNTCGHLGMVRGYKCVSITGRASDVTLRNNIAYGSWFSIDVLDPSEIDSDYNMFWSERAMPTVEGPHSTTIDSDFVDYRRGESFDFHLRAGSPAIDAGDPDLVFSVGLQGSFADRDGTSRPQEGGYDIGAYEYSP